MFQLIDVIDFSAYTANLANMLSRVGVIQALGCANRRRRNDDEEGKE
jgi:hypothetical protein